MRFERGIVICSPGRIFSSSEHNELLREGSVFYTREGCEARLDGAWHDTGVSVNTDIEFFVMSGNLKFNLNIRTSGPQFAIFDLQKTRIFMEAKGNTDFTASNRNSFIIIEDFCGEADFMSINGGMALYCVSDNGGYKVWNQWFDDFMLEYKGINTNRATYTHGYCF